MAIKFNPNHNIEIVTGGELPVTKTGVNRKNKPVLLSPVAKIKKEDVERVRNKLKKMNMEDILINEGMENKEIKEKIIKKINRKHGYIAIDILKTPR